MAHDMVAWSEPKEHVPIQFTEKDGGTVLVIHVTGCLTSAVKVTYQVWPTAAEMALASARLFAEKVEQAVARRGIARMAISGGSTPQATFMGAG
jgi:hypothetical protein